jgi:hypothetical protein
VSRKILERVVKKFIGSSVRFVSQIFQKYVPSAATKGEDPKQVESISLLITE